MIQVNTPVIATTVIYEKLFWRLQALQLDASVGQVANVLQQRIRGIQHEQ